MKKCKKMILQSKALALLETAGECIELGEAIRANELIIDASKTLRKLGFRHRTIAQTRKERDKR